MKRLLSAVLMTSVLTTVTPATASTGGRGPTVPVAARTSDCKDDVLCLTIDLIMCTIFILMAGTYGPYYVGSDGEVYQMALVEIGTDGDVTVAGNPFWDCPPYDDDGV